MDDFLGLTLPSPFYIKKCSSFYSWTEGCLGSYVLSTLGSLPVFQPCCVNTFRSKLPKALRSFARSRSDPAKDYWFNYDFIQLQLRAAVRPIRSQCLSNGRVDTTSGLGMRNGSLVAGTLNTRARLPPLVCSRILLLEIAVVNFISEP